MMKGVHPDILFGDWRVSPEDPYSSAKSKARHVLGKIKVKYMHIEMLQNPDRFGLSPEEVDAVTKVATQRNG